MIKAGIVGGTGYTGVELLRLLAQHPEVELVAITSRKGAGPHVDAIFPGLRGCVELAFTQPDKAALHSNFERWFASEPFVDVLPAGSHPDTRSVRGANLCRISVHRPSESAARSDTIVVLSVIDNLVKGASGQAVQDMNISCGLPKAAGLGQLPVVP